MVSKVAVSSALFCAVSSLSSCGGSPSGTAVDDPYRSSQQNSQSQLGQQMLASVVMASPTAMEPRLTGGGLGGGGLGGGGLVQSLGGRSYDEERDALDSQITATTAAGCAFVPELPPNPSAIDCYGPELDYQNHPDSPNMNSSNGMLPGGDLAIWKATNGNTPEACVAAKANAEIGSVAAFFNLSIRSLAMGFCSARIDELTTYPAVVGDVADLAPSIQRVSGAILPGVTIESATLTRTPDVSGQPAYLTHMVISTNHARFDISLHSANIDLPNGVSRGKLWATAEISQPSPFTRAISLVYDKAGPDSLKYEVRRTNLNGSATQPDVFDGSHNVILGKTGSQGSSIGVFDVNPTSATGRAAFGWVAGQQFENLRSIVVNVERGSDGKRTGCGYVGFGRPLVDVMQSPARTGFLDRFICNWAGPGNSHNGVPAVQEQCVADNATGILAPTVSHIAFAPRSSCGAAGDLSPYGAFQVRVRGTGAYVPAASEHDLVNLATVQESKRLPPTPPSDL